MSHMCHHPHCEWLTFRDLANLSEHFPLPELVPDADISGIGVSLRILHLTLNANSIGHPRVLDNRIFYIGTTDSALCVRLRSTKA